MPEDLFCQATRGQLRVAEVWRDDQVVAFLDHRPLFKGHVLVCPIQHATTLVDLPQGLIAPLFARVQAIAAVMPAALGADGTFVAMNNVVSQSVPHLHVHVIPRRRGDGLRGFFWPRTRYAPGEDEDYAAKLRSALESGPA